MTKTIKILLFILAVVIVFDCCVIGYVNRESIVEWGNHIISTTESGITLPGFSELFEKRDGKETEEENKTPSSVPYETPPKNELVTEKPSVTASIPTPDEKPETIQQDPSPTIAPAVEPTIEEDKNANFAEEFFALCKTGELWSAAEWLQEHEEPFPNKEQWENAIMLYLPFCGTWAVYYGDSSIVPTSAGVQIMIKKMKATVCVTNEEAVLHLSDVDENQFAVDLLAPFGELPFEVETEMAIWYWKGVGTYCYDAKINEQGRLSYTRYYEGKMSGNCEFVRLE